MPPTTQIRIRRDTAANFTSANPTLALGEIAYETDTFRFKVGTGSTAWTALGYAAQNPTSLTVTDATASTSTTTGALRVTGGVGVGGALNVGGGMTVRPNANAPTSNVTIGPTAGAALNAAATDSILIGSGAGDVVQASANNIALGTNALGAFVSGALLITTTVVGSGGVAGTYTVPLTKDSGTGEMSVYPTISATVGAGGTVTSTSFTTNVEGGGGITVVGSTPTVQSGIIFRPADPVPSGFPSNFRCRLDSVQGDNVAIGQDALLLNSTGRDNIAIGVRSADANTTGQGNICLGRDAGGGLTTGNGNVIIGTGAATASTNMGGCIAIGSQACPSLNASGTIVIGPRSGFSITTNAGNTTIVGSAAAQSSTSNVDGTVFGGAALQSCTSITGTTAIGASAGRYVGPTGTTANNGTSVNNVYIGLRSRSSAVGQTNEVVIGGVDACGDGSNTTVIGTTATTSTRIPAGTLTLSNGNLILGTAGNGIDFSADAHATGMTSELLDDYEEGTWTPVYEASTTPFTTMTMDVVSARYTKVGRLVTIDAHIRTDNVDATGATGSLHITGLPFTNSSASQSSMYIGHVTQFATSPMSGWIVGGGTYIRLLTRGALNGTTNSAPVSCLTTGATADQNNLFFAAVYYAT